MAGAGSAHYPRQERHDDIQSEREHLDSAALANRVIGTSLD